jgi:hypothetical protein
MRTQFRAILGAGAEERQRIGVGLREVSEFKRCPSNRRKFLTENEVGTENRGSNEPFRQLDGRFETGDPRSHSRARLFYFECSETIQVGDFCTILMQSRGRTVETLAVTNGRFVDRHDR